MTTISPTSDDQSTDGVGDGSGHPGDTHTALSPEEELEGGTATGFEASVATRPAPPNDRGAAGAFGRYGQGDVIGRYLVAKAIGHGGMGAVYLG